jgi:type I restriction enzyme S subunit
MPGDLPEGWRIHRISEIAEVYDGPHATPKTIDSGPVFLGIQALRNGRLALRDTRHVSEVDFAKWTRRVEPRCDDLVFSYETRLGEAALIPPGLRCCLGRRMGLLRLRSQAAVIPRMLLLAYLGPQFQAELRHNTIHGSTVDRLPIAGFGDFRIALPPVREQRAIVEVLGVLDDKIASNRRLADAADAAWLAHAAHRLRDASTIPVEELLVDDVLVINDGYRAKNSELIDEGLAFVRAGNLTEDGLDLSGADRVPDELAARVGTKRSVPWDTAFTSKGTVGRITLVGPDADTFVYSPQVCFWRSTDPQRLSPFVLHAWMRSAQFTAQIDAVKGQTDMADYVSLRDQRAMRLNLPDPSVQLEVTGFAEPLARQAGAVRKEARTLAAIRDALLPKLVSGMIRVPPSTDADEQVGAAVEALV